jgi:hypothetical protein
MSEREERDGIAFPWRPGFSRQDRLEIAQVVALLQTLCPGAKRKEVIAEAAKQCDISARRVHAARAEFEDVAVARVERVFHPPPTKKRRGRPKSAAKLPGDILLHLIELCRLRPAGTSLRQWCREMAGRARLVDPNT